MTTTETSVPATGLAVLNSSSSSAHVASSCSIDESYKYIFLPICYSFTFLFSISLNSIVLFRSFRRTKPWNASLIYMVNLASTDFMYGLSLPFLIASYMMRDNWVFGDFMCRLVRFLFYFNLYCSIFFLTCISVHRYLGICHPMRTITMETKRAVKATCVLVWVVVFALTCPIFRFAKTGHMTREMGSAVTVNGDPHAGNHGNGVEAFQNCWDDAIDREFSEYVPYGIILHLLGFFLPFSIIAWCYSHVVLTIFRTLRSQGPAATPGGGRAGAGGRQDNVIGGGGGREGMSIILGAHSPYAHRRRKSIRTIITITLLFALCFFPFHVTRTIFLILKVTKRVPCHTMTMVSMCYKITRPLASFNAWLNALLYFLTKEKSAPCCHPPDTTTTPHAARGNAHGNHNNHPHDNYHKHSLLWSLRMMAGLGNEEGGEGGGGEVEVEEGVNGKKKEKKKSRTPVYLHKALPKVKFTVE
ncbi:P2Y purinoceptor 3 [Hypomesus transpacificus]|uniref:P2Y purinoceptor 3 n=1 Tax=Hypomesus transpacificus TaxID=137520 RepID=UPI001F07FA21|nr:P2Y purinoceptor 3 [Hypomesus transpacificus]XP_046872902.1 P2Y purinoceptor 3 [Hypomesus transpacificus]XP_046872903.1 P2Y purinoceptor 3 [Hypomesus transpacificus]